MKANIDGGNLQPPPVQGLSREIGWTYLHLMISTAGTLFVTGYAVRKLGADDFGTFALLAAIASLLNLFEFALGMTTTRASALDKTAADDAVRTEARKEVTGAHAAYMTVGTVSIVLVILSSALMFVTLRDVQNGPGLVTTGLLSGLSVALATASSALLGITTGRRNFRRIAGAVALGTTANIAVVVLSSPHLGIVSLGLGQLASIVTNRALLALFIKRDLTWFKFMPKGSSWSDIRRVARFAAPLLVLTVGGQLINAVDLIVVAAVTSATIAGFYRVGSLIPTMAVQILYRGYDAAFPLLVGSDKTAQEEMVRFLTRIAGYLAGLGFGTLAFVRHDVVREVIGRPEPVTASVLLIFCFVWLANVPVHGLALVLIARGRQRSFVPLVALEVVANMALTMLLTPAFGPGGAAFATLFSIAISNLLILPAVIKRELEASPLKIVLAGALSETIGGMLAAVAFLSVSWLEPSTARLCLAFSASALVGVCIGWPLLGQGGREILRSSLQSRRPVPGLMDQAPAPTELGVVD